MDQRQENSGEQNTALCARRALGTRAHTEGTRTGTVTARVQWCCITYTHTLTRCLHAPFIAHRTRIRVSAASRQADNATGFTN